MPLTIEQSNAMLKRALVDKGYRELLLSHPNEAAKEFGAHFQQDECEKMEELRSKIENAAQALDAAIGDQVLISQLLPLHVISD